jgi:formylglycine-generating enzyme required for sulfatase activity
LLQAAFIPWLARIDPESGLPMRRVARFDEFPQDARAMVERFVEARLLVADRRSDVDVVEVAHESLLRQWPELTTWLKADAEDLKRVQAIEAAAGEWERQGRHVDWLEHHGARLRDAERIARREDFGKRLGDQCLAYLAACRARERARRLKVGTLSAACLAVIVAGAAAWRYQHHLKDLIYWATHVRGHVLTATREHDLRSGESFRECADCPEMIVVPAGSFMMGSPDGQGDRSGREYPQHPVAIPSRFAVGKLEVTFAEWDACAAHGPCNSQINSNGWGHGGQPVIHVTWNEAQAYVKWLARITGKPYRLLSEAEYEYAARAGGSTIYPWGPDIGNGNANCGDCGSQWDRTQTAPAGSFPANRFGLKDMVGNVFQWVEDCAHDNYKGAPANGSAWSSDTCTSHVVRGGAWLSHPRLLRSASRDWYAADDHHDYIGFRVARTLSP